MSDTITEAEIREKLSQHYGGDNSHRELVRNVRNDNHGEVGSVVYSLSGSPPKGYAIAITGVSPSVNLYDNRGERFRNLRRTTVAEVDELLNDGHE